MASKCFLDFGGEVFSKELKNLALQFDLPEHGFPRDANNLDLYNLL